jgi:hypothetical protein
LLLFWPGARFGADSHTCSYPVLWNVFKRLAGGYSADEKYALFSGAAKKAYRLRDEPGLVAGCRRVFAAAGRRRGGHFRDVENPPARAD